jgi:2',3'-cyclic-nucleotide 2'-phosphodiesterase (5'-nucleotidase family)
MKKVELKLLIFIGILACTACTPKHYAVKSIEVSRIEMNNSWDAGANPEIAALVDSFKTKMNAEMNEEIGTAAQTLKKGLPQSLLSNFTADVMLEFGENRWGKVDFSLMNMGGMRTSLNAGIVTITKMYEIYPFNNRMVLLELPGTDVKDLFDSIAYYGGEGLSKSIEMVIKDKKVNSLKIGGKPFDEQKTYRIATIDYLAEGNDKMKALARATEYTDSSILLRDVMINYIKKLTANKKEINANLDDRIKM